MSHAEVTDAQVKVIDELRRLGEELRAMFADERRAIAALDTAKLQFIASTKQLVAARLAELAPHAPKSPELHALFHAVRVEAHATAQLAATASQAVRALLGYEASSAYDRRARHATVIPARILAAP